MRCYGRFEVTRKVAGQRAAPAHANADPNVVRHKEFIRIAR
jgi:hypothetical protein